MGPKSREYNVRAGREVANTGQVGTEAGLGHARNAWGPRSCKRQEGPPQDPCREQGSPLADTSVSDFWPRSCERINIYCFRLSGVWYLPWQPRKRMCSPFLFAHLLLFLVRPPAEDPTLLPPLQPPARPKAAPPTTTLGVSEPLFWGTFFLFVIPPSAPPGPTQSAWLPSS